MKLSTICYPYCVAAFMAMLFAGAISAQGARYDPLAIPHRNAPAHIDLTVQDVARKRAIPLRVYLPADKGPAPVVLFSHGLGGSSTGSAYLGEHWAARGYVGVFLQHAGSDESVWKDKPVAQRMQAMRQAAGKDGGRNFLLRVKDVATVLDELTRWNADAEHALAGRLNLARVGMCGHSFGAVTTQAVSGQRFGRGNLSFTDPRVTAAVMFSPSSPRQGLDPARSFGQVEIPWLLMTGTKDVALIGDADVESRLTVYPALPPGGKYELVLQDAEHSAFADCALPGDDLPRNPNHHRAILALSTAFWDAWLRNDAAAKAWLDGNGPRTVLEQDDRWQRK